MSQVQYGAKKSKGKKFHNGLWKVVIEVYTKYCPKSPKNDPICYGGMARLQKELECEESAVRRWMRLDGSIPKRYIPKLIELSNGTVTEYDLSHID